VIWHQRPRRGPEPDTEPSLKKEKLDKPAGHITKWEKTVNEKGVVVAVVLVALTAAASLLYRMATRGGLQPSSIMPPFTHTIDRRDTRARA
jgi:hypothetical protein